jgi:glycosyltransferase 2 family protein
VVGRKLRKAAFTLLGVAVSVAALGMAFFRIVRGPDGVAIQPRFDFDVWVADLPRHLIWWIPFLLLNAALPALRSLVWGFTIPPPPPSVSARYHAFAIGALVHNTMPARLGLLVTAWFVSRRVKRPVVELLASLLVSKLLELATLVMAIAVLIPLVRTSSAGGMGRTALAGFVLVAALGALLVLLSRLAPRLASWLRSRQRAPRVVAFLDALNVGVRGVGSLRRLGMGLVAALGPVSAAGLAYGLALAHAGASSGLAGGWLLLGALTLGQFTPGLPVGTGVFLFVCSWAARTLGADDASAATIAVLTHTGSVLANLAVGAVSALIHRRELREFLRLRRQKSEAAARAQ